MWPPSCVIEESCWNYQEGLHVSIQLAVISWLDVATMILVEVGEAVVHEDAALLIRIKVWKTNCSTVVCVNTYGEYFKVLTRFSHFIRLLQVERYHAGAWPRAVPAEALGAVEAGTGHVLSCIINLQAGEKTFCITVFRTVATMCLRWNRQNKDSQGRQAAVNKKTKCTNHKMYLKKKTKVLCKILWDEWALLWLTMTTSQG